MLDFAGTGESPESRIQEIHLTCSPDEKSHTAQETKAHGWLREKESRGFSSQAPPLPAAPPCDVLSSCGHHRPHVLESLTGRAGKLVKQLVWIPVFQLSFFLIRLFHHFLKKKKKIGYINNFFAFSLVYLPPPLLPSLSGNETHNLLYVSHSFHCTCKLTE